MSAGLLFSYGVGVGVPLPEALGVGVGVLTPPFGVGVEVVSAARCSSAVCRISGVITWLGIASSVCQSPIAWT